MTSSSSAAPVQAAAPPSAASAAPPLPPQLSTFVGREREIGALRELLRTTRLLTLTGAGGSGKTRLALEVAGQAGDAFADGVAWVELAALAQGDLLPQHVASALGLVADGARPVMDVLLEGVRGRDLLLVLDNCEHLVQAAAVLADALLRAAPSLRILATGREALGISGERAWLVPALELPAAGAVAEAVADSEAVRLFVDRARDVLVGFALTPGNAEAAAQICRRLDGLPLAIELAAARVKVLSPEQIAERLDDAFRLLTSGSRTALPRHRTLRATLDWSHALLTPAEQTLLRRLSVFRGDFSLAAAETVCAGDGIEGWEILDLLAALVDKSLLAVHEADGTARYALLQTVMQYAHERLREAGEDERFARRHAEFFLAFVEEDGFPLGRSLPPRYVRGLQQEHDNLRAALRWAVDSGQTETATRLAGGLWLLWARQGHLAEGRRWLDEVLRMGGSASPRARARVLFTAGNLARLQLDAAAAAPPLEEALGLYQQIGDADWLARTLHRLGCVVTEQGDLPRAEQLIRESIAVAGEENTGWRIPLLCSLGAIAEARGDLPGAAALYQEGLELARGTGFHDVAALLGSLGRIVHLDGDHRRAATLFRDCLERAYALRDRINVATVLADLGGVAGTAGEPERAARLLAASEALFAALGTHHSATTRASYDASLRAARAQTDPATWERAWSEGLAMPLDTAVRYALSVDAEPSASPAVIVPEPAAAPAMEVVRVDAHPSAEPALRVLALGPLEIHQGGERMPEDAWSYARPRELLLYLLCHPEGRTREQIGLVFWPDASRAQVKNSFHVMLHRLRKTLGVADCVVLEGERYRIGPALDVWFDAEVFEREVSAALRDEQWGADAVRRLESALALYRGDFLEGEPVGDWHLEVHDRLRRLYVDALSALGEARMDAGEYAGAAAAFERLLQREDLDEESHRRLMLCLARGGHRDRALRQHERIVALLRDELDADPEPETVHLFERIRRAEPV